MNKPALLALGTALGSIAMAGPVMAAGAGSMNSGTSMSQTGGMNTTGGTSENGGMEQNTSGNGSGLSRKGQFTSKSSVPTTGLASLYVAPLASYTDNDAERRTGFGVGGSLRIGKILSEHFNTELSLSGSHFFRHSSAGNQWDTFSAGLHGLFFFFRGRSISPNVDVSPFVDVGTEFVRSREKGAATGGNWSYQNSPAFNADLGANFRLNNYGVKLRMEGGYQWTLSNTRPAAAGGGRYVFAEPQGYIGIQIPLSSQQPPPRKVATVKDSDHDGVPNNQDQCPDTPRGAQVNAKGCALDSDHDNVPNGIDQCPNTPPGTQVNAKGCPIKQKAKDSDHDGVPNSKDQCPNTPRGEQVLANGCAVKATRTLKQVTFALNSSKLTGESKQALQIEADRLKKVFKQHPKAHVQINGYTDSTGAASYNKKLSLRRAKAVRQYLVKQGISGNRLKAKGFGESNPVASNKTRTGRLENRRVEVKVLK